VFSTDHPAKKFNGRRALRETRMHKAMSKKTTEVDRLEASRSQAEARKKWGPYLSEREWARFARAIAKMVMLGIS